MSWVPPPLSVQFANAKLAHGVLIAGWPEAPGGALAGFDEKTTCAILAQLKDEAAYDPFAIGDHCNAEGEEQWWPLRRTIIRDGLKDASGKLVIPGCGIDLGLTGPLPDLITQTHAVIWELYHSELPALRLIQASTSVYTAGLTATVAYSRPKPPDNRVQRGNDAVALFARFNP